LKKSTGCIYKSVVQIVQKLSLHINLWVNILNVNEPVSNLSLLPNVVTENTPLGTIVGAFNLVDPDYVDSDIYIPIIDIEFSPCSICDFLEPFPLVSDSNQSAAGSEL